ncbi:MAG: NAD(P)H-dependent oxidoreductase subunit E [Ruminococcaceae bacterium]|nr:NAD(P)H-dependent oxidoreductase subunit E [Oscillospiraceae bacterium]
MKKNLTTVMFRGTRAQEEQLYAVIERHRDTPGALMPILQEAQEIYGYLPMEVQKMIALKMGISVEEVYGVATFYSQFALNPKGEVSIAVCLGTACYVKGSGDILDRIVEVLGVPAGSTSSDGKYSIEATRCIGACGLAPVLTINNEVYGRLTKADVDGILAKYK